MIRRLLRFGVRLSLLLGAALAVSKVVQSRRQPEPPLPTPPQEPERLKPALREVGEDVVVGRAEPPPVEPWVDPDMAGLCPSTHPVKAKLSSGIFHVPGGLAYTRTRADRCYCDEKTAEGDGLRRAKR